jgi:O-antigen/teichoic acid export membrane protein
MWGDSSTLWYFVPTLVGAVLPLLTLPLITHVLTPAEYGAWVLAAVYGIFLSGLGNLGLTVAYDRNFFEFTDPRKNAALLWGTTLLVSSLLAVLIGISWIGRDVVAVQLLRLPGYGALVAWTTTAIGVGSLKQYFLLYFRNTGEARLYALFSIDESVLSALLTVAFVFILQVGPVGLAWGPLVASSLVLITLLRTVSRRVPPELHPEPILASLRLSYPLLPRIVLGVVGTQFDKWIVGVLGGAGSAGIYAIGQKLANVVFLVATALENKFQPRTYQLLFEGAAGAGARVGRLLTPYAYLIVGCGLILSLFAAEAVSLLTSPEYAAAAAVCYILVPHYAMMFFGKQPQLIFAKRTGTLSALSIVSMGVTIVITTLAAQAGGVLGAAFGALVGGGLGLIAFVWLSQRAFRIDFEKGKLFQYYGILAVACGGLLLASRLGWGGSQWIPIKALILGLYAWIGWRGGMFRRLAPAAE